MSITAPREVDLNVVSAVDLCGVGVSQGAVYRTFCLALVSCV